MSHAPPATSSLHPASATNSPRIQRSLSAKAALNDPTLALNLKDATPHRSYNDPNSPSNGARLRFEKLVRRYVGESACAGRDWAGLVAALGLSTTYMVGGVSTVYYPLQNQTLPGVAASWGGRVVAGMVGGAVAVAGALVVL
ncbi:hypothetical protein BDK51DRAFT_52057 [Blyttiomyces helicus]|uniref:Uncharacterized protein n=1 Tax=Blyttiomyces helicus TaxID=388810 RepID=A0A4P9VW10_9FUNG|nr:hypothetical protein BDK51DRAFT_52057 [Blyttiomyces helicus]|eukprot:RKO83879.1 hypothetical protein BDK51DRAFT_52057 [Blyttiomyces helicus]